MYFLEALADPIDQRVNQQRGDDCEHAVDPQTGQALVRSTRPDVQVDQTRYYEIVLQMPGQLTLRRYQVVPGQPREQIDLQVTHEVLQKLVPDLVQTALTGK